MRTFFDRMDSPAAIGYSADGGSLDVERRLAAILATDVVGYSRMIRADEEGTLAALKALRQDVIDPKIAAHGGRIVKLMGDGMLAEFASVVDAVRAATEVQHGVAESNAEHPHAPQFLFRMGINLGDVVIDADDIHGDGVNVASRLEGLAEPGGICVSLGVYDQVRNRTDLTFEDLGEKILKNIDEPVRVWQWVADETAQMRFQDVAEPSPLSENPSIAVLPFDNMSPDLNQQFFADGFCEDLTTALSKVDNLRVVSRTQAFLYKDNPIGAAKAGQELGARYVVEGSVRTAGNRIRINAQLIEAQSGHHLWAEKFDGSLEDVFEFQDNITQQVVAELEVRLSDGEQVHVWREEARAPKAYDHFIRGRALYKEYSQAANLRARREYEAALAISPEFVSAMVGLARTHIEEASFGWASDRSASLDEARRLLNEAFRISDDHGLAHAELAHLLMVEGDFEAARAEAERAVAKDPNLADAQSVLAFVLVCLELPNEALRAARMGIKLSPGTPEFYFIAMAEAYIALARYDDAVAVLRRIEARRPHWLMAHALLAISYQGLGQGEAARQSAQNIMDLSTTFTATKWSRTILYPNRHDVPEMMRMLVAAGLPD